MKSVKFDLIALALIFSLLFIGFGCNSGDNTQEALNNAAENALETAFELVNPLENVDVPNLSFSFEAQEDFSTTLDNGTKISIPAGTLVDSDGNPVKGGVKLKYRELHSPGEIIASGMTMRYDSAGTTYNFETAGMFEIRAFKNGKPVFIKDGKQVEVQMASYREGDYNFYQFDEEKENWQYMGFAQPKAYLPDQTADDQPAETTDQEIVVPASTLMKPVKFDKKNDFIIQIKANYKHFPELRPYSGVMWKYAGESEEEKKEIASKIWSGSELLSHKPEESLYRLKLTSGKKSYEYLVSPIFSERSYEKAVALYEQKRRRFEVGKKEHQRRTHETKVIRKYPVTNFGFCNWDAIYANPNQVIVKAKFDFGQRNEEIMPEAISVFLITGKNDNVVMRFGYEDFNRFNFDPTKKNKIVAILPGNSVAVFGSEDFKKLSVPRSVQTQLPEQTFAMRELPDKIETPDDLDRIIKSL